MMSEGRAYLKDEATFDVLICLLGYRSTLPRPAWDDTASRVMTPRLILPGTDSMSIQKETHETATIRIEGR